MHLPQESLRHLRIEQVCYYTAAAADAEQETHENTVPEPETSAVDRTHKNYDAFMETVKEGTVFKSSGPGLESVRRRKQSRLGVSRTGFIAPLGESREEYYEQKLLLTLPWFCSTCPVKNADGDAEWRFVWEPPASACVGDETLPRKELLLTDKAKVSFEHLCQSYEQEICSKTDIICGCCEAETSVCKSCRHSVGFHTCEKDPELKWRKQSLFGGRLDCERCLWNLHRKRVPIDVIRNKAREFSGRDLLTEAQVLKMITAIEQERNIERVSNSDVQVGEALEVSSGDLEEKLWDMLQERVANMKAGDGVTCQYRVYQEIIEHLEKNIPLRLLIQAMPC